MKEETVTGTPIGMKETAMFADRENIIEAFNYVKEIMERSTNPEMALYGTTAIQVIWNTLANKYHLIKK